MDPPPSHSSSSSSSAAPSSQGALLSQPSGSSGKEQPLVPLVMREFCDKEQKKPAKILTAFSLLGLDVALEKVKASGWQNVTQEELVLKSTFPLQSTLIPPGTRSSVTVKDVFLAIIDPVADHLVDACNAHLRLTHAASRGPKP